MFILFVDSGILVTDGHQRTGRNSLEEAHFLAYSVGSDAVECCCSHEENNLGEELRKVVAGSKTSVFRERVSDEEGVRGESIFICLSTLLLAEEGEQEGLQSVVLVAS